MGWLVLGKSFKAQQIQRSKPHWRFWPQMHLLNDNHDNNSAYDYTLEVANQGKHWAMKVVDYGRKGKATHQHPWKQHPQWSAAAFCLDSCLKLTGPLSLELLGGNTTDAWALLNRRAPNTKPWEVQYAGSIWQCRYLVISQLYNYGYRDAHQNGINIWSI